jgi:glutathione S-transferase
MAGSYWGIWRQCLVVGACVVIQVALLLRAPLTGVDAFAIQPPSSCIDISKEIATCTWSRTAGGVNIRACSRRIGYISVESALQAAPSKAAWQDLERQLPNLEIESDRSSIDSALPPYDTTTPKYSNTKPTLFRERHGWCPYSERVWLALEYKNLPYDTIRIDNTGPGRKPAYFTAGTTPQMRWADGKKQGESMDLVQRLDKLYHPDTDMNTPSLYPASKVDEIDSAISQFRSIFPSGARPSSRAAFLFSWNGDPLGQAHFEKALQGTNDLLGGSSKEGPFFCGSEFTAADVAWAPFLERYAAQLPCFYDTLNARDATKYPHLSKWYEAMETQVPAYRCRVMGDASSWRKVLTMAGYGNDGSSVPKSIRERMELAGATTQQELRQTQTVSTSDDGTTGHSTKSDQQVWSEYVAQRPWMADSPAKEVASILVRNREAITKDVERLAKPPHSRQSLPTGSDLDSAMMALVTVLLSPGTISDMKDAANANDHSPHDVGILASFLDERMCVPRDMGLPCALAIKRVAAILSE